MEHLSPSEGRFLIALRERGFVHPDRILPAVAAAGMPYAEATRASRRQRGILFRRLRHSQATAIAEELLRQGVGVSLESEGLFPDFSRTVMLGALRIDDLGITAPALVALGQPGFLAWDDVALVTLGVYEGDNAHSLSSVEPAILSGATTHEDHHVMGKQTFETLTRREFDLGTYLDTHPEDAVNYRRKSAEAQKKRRGLKIFSSRPKTAGSEPVEPRRFSIGNPELEARLLVSDGNVAWQLSLHTGTMTIDGERPAGHWMRPLHAAAEYAMRSARRATITPEVKALVERADHAAYIVEDWDSFADGARWWLNNIDLSQFAPSAVEEVPAESREMSAAAE